jgi:hypothetical protein
MRKTITLITMISAIYIPLALLDYDHFPYSDGAEHGAAVRELAQNIRNPGDPLLAGHYGNSPRFVPSILLMALSMRVLKLDVLVILKLFLIIYFFLFLLAASLFSREYFNDTGQVLWSVTALLFLWGSGWTGANAYMFSALLYTAYFPSVVSFSLALLALYFQLRFLRCKKFSFLITQILLGSFAFVNHPLTGVFFFICSGLLYFEKRGCDQKALLHYALAVAAALVLITLWPYYSLFASLLKLATGEMARAGDYQSTQRYLHSHVLVRSGPALAGIACSVLFIKQKRFLMLVGGFVIFSLIYLTGYAYRISLTERFVFFIMFSLQLSAARIGREWFSTRPLQEDRRKIIALFIVCSILLGMIIQAIFVGTKFIAPAFAFKPGVTVPAYATPNLMQLELKNYLSDRDVVLSDIYSSWSIPVYTGAKIIALFHTAPHIVDNAERIKTVETFYDTGTTNKSRKAILEKYHITHVLLNFQITGRDLEPLLQEMGCSIVARSKDFCLFSISPPRGDESTPRKSTW